MTRACHACSYSPSGLGSCGAGLFIRTAQPPFVMGIAQSQLSACARPAKPVTATEANADVAIRDATIVAMFDVLVIVRYSSFAG